MNVLIIAGSVPSYVWTIKNRPVSILQIDNYSVQAEKFVLFINIVNGTDILHCSNSGVKKVVFNMQLINLMIRVCIDLRN